MCRRASCPSVFAFVYITVYITDRVHFVYITDLSVLIRGHCCMSIVDGSDYCSKA